MRKLSLLALVLGFAAAGCRGDSGDDAPGIDSGSNNNNDVTIQEVQDPAMTNGTPVTLKGVVVTAIDSFGGKTGDFWVQEPTGGEFSGIHVFGAPLDQVAALQVGSVVDITGAEKDDFAYQGNMGSGGFDEGYAITELKPLAGGEMTVTATGATMVLEPTVVDALMIGGISDYMARDAEWEKWEGVLIKLVNVTATSDQDCVGSACNDSTLHKFEVTGGAVVESALAAFPEMDEMAAGAVDRGECVASVTGVLDYFFDYLLLPRSTDELVLTGGNCPTENSMATCTDGMDNDGNGFMDCDDNACVAAVASCRTVMTISEIQTASTPPTGGVELQNVFVTALERTTGTQKPRSMYVQTAASASASNGILIFGNNSTDLSAYSVGDRVNVIGKVVEFNDSGNNGTGTLTEISLIAHSAGSGGGGNIMPVTGQTPTLLSVDATGELYESVLVQLENVRLKTVGDSQYHVGTMSDGTTTFKFDDNLYRIIESGTGAVAADTCIDVIEGVWSYQVYDNAWYFLPTEAPDVTGGTCAP